MFLSITLDYDAIKLFSNQTVRRPKKYCIDAPYELSSSYVAPIVKLML